MTFQINLTIDSEGLDNIYKAGQSVTLSQSVTSTVEAVAISPLSLVVAWLVFQPLGSNQVVWNDSYFLYGTTTELQVNAVIQLNAEMENPAQPGWTYTFENGQFSGASGGGSWYVVSNQMQGSFSFGLAVSATVNNAVYSAPLNVAPVLFNEEAYFMPLCDVSVFLSSAAGNGTVIPPPPNALSVTLNEQNPTANVSFNDATNLFYLES